MECWPPPRTARWPTLALLLLGVAGCTAPAPHTPPAAATAGPGYGTIVAMRPPPPAAQARGGVLAALGAPAMAPDGRVEFIVRTDDGEPVSVMQRPQDGLRAGGRVALIPGSRTRIAPATAAP